jgi:hypothetical protein
MTSKVNFNTVGMIKACFLVAFLILPSGSVQASPQRLKIFLAGQSNSKAADALPSYALQSYLRDKVLQNLRNQYPCADYMTDDGAAAMLRFERDRQLLGQKDEDFYRMLRVPSALSMLCLSMSSRSMAHLR